ncbi:hypothetical protein DPMN_097165, partial [Dreissena polymorpha]
QMSMAQQIIIAVQRLPDLDGLSGRIADRRDVTMGDYENFQSIPFVYKTSRKTVYKLLDERDFGDEQADKDILV